ncbi:MAG: hypothetical protein RIQ81_1929 [Pseudomonadota bacterium]|jgi:hypothetical protein
MRILIACAVLALGSACSTTLSGRLEGPELGADSLRDARVNVTRLDAAADDQSSSQDGPVAYILVPSSDGSFSSSESLPEGRYLVEALVPGYEPVSEQLQLDSSKKITLNLKPTGQAKARSTDYNADPSASRGEGSAVLTLPQF